MHRVNIVVEQPRTVEFAEDRGDPARTMDVLHVVVRVRRDLGETRNFAGQTINISKIEIDVALLRRSKNVQNSVRRSTHGHIEGHGVIKNMLIRDVTREDTIVIVVVIALAHVDDRPASVLKECAPGRVRSQRGAVTGE